jgi:hypothetical protein
MKFWKRGAGGAGALAERPDTDQKTSLNRPMTTTRPIRKMIPTVLPRNFNMGHNSLQWVLLL